MGLLPPKVSVILPTYNRSLLLPRAVVSVMGQKFKDWDLWIIDDGSTDETPQLVQQWEGDLRFHYLRTPNRGVSAARNLGIKSCEGEWIAFLDSDDEWLPSKLNMQFALLAQRPDFKVIHTEEIWIRNGVRVNPMKKHQKFGGHIYEKCLPLCLMSPSSILIHREVFQNVGLFREDFPVCEDYDLWLKITSRYEVGFVETPQIRKYGGHEDQLSRSRPAMDYYRVQSMYSLLQEGHLSSKQREATLEVLKQKCQVLLKGHEKHQNIQVLEHIREIYLNLERNLQKQ